MSLQSESVAMTNENNDLQRPKAVCRFDTPPDLTVPSKPKQRRCFPTRASIALMTFLGAVSFYMVRANFSLNLLAMIVKTADNDTTVIIEQPDYGPRIHWTVYEQSALLGAFFYGYAIGAVPIGMLVEKYGLAKAYICIALIVCAALEMASPLVAETSYGLSVFMRLMMGIMQSAYFPSTHKLISKWAPRKELGKFVFASFGASAGTLVTWTFTGFLIEHAGWKMSFYLPAVILGVFAVAWYFVVYETPDDHPRISSRELAYIGRNLTNVSKGNNWPPFGSIIRSPPCWALLLMQFGSDWGLYFVLTGVPKFLNQILGFQIASTGVLSSLPYLCRWVFSFVYGQIADALLVRNYVTVTRLRKVTSIFSHVLPGVLILGMSYLSEYPYLCVAFMSMSLGFNGTLVQSTLCNYHDLAPNYASSLNSIINGISSCTGFFSPMIVAYFTAEKNDIEQWRYVFLIGAMVYIIPAVVFVFIGSATVQEWNEYDTRKNAPTNGGGAAQPLNSMPA